MMLTIIIFILVLSILVFVHELGHFLSARKFGVKAEEFGFGFPPRVWGIYKNTDGKWKQVWGSKEVADSPKTIYSLNWIPLGGFVKIKGENGENEAENDSFASRSIWQRAVMLSAGVTMNVFLAAVLISVGLMIGLPQVLEGVNPQAKVTDKKIQIVQVMADSAAAKAELKIGDVIMGIDGKKFDNYEQLQTYVAEHPNQQLNYKIKRGTEEMDKIITPEVRQETGKAGIGVGITETGLVSYPWYLAIWYGIKETVLLVWAIIVAFFQLIKGLILGHGVSADLAGPVGIAALTGQVARMGFVYLLQLTALLSVNLAVINFLPFPALDGGRVLFLIIEKIKGKPVKRELESIIHNIGFLLLLLLVFVVTFRDVSKLGAIKNLLERIIG